MRSFLPIVLALAATGCAGPSASRPDAARQAANDRAQALKAQLQDLSPEELKAYFDAHPEAVRTIRGEAARP